MNGIDPKAGLQQVPHQAIQKWGHKGQRGGSGTASDGGTAALAAAEGETENSDSSEAVGGAAHKRGVELPPGCKIVSTVPSPPLKTEPRSCTCAENKLTCLLTPSLPPSLRRRQVRGRPDEVIPVADEEATCSCAAGKPHQKPVPCVCIGRWLKIAPTDKNEAQRQMRGRELTADAERSAQEDERYIIKILDIDTYWPANGPPSPPPPPPTT